MHDLFEGTPHAPFVPAPAVAKPWRPPPATIQRTAVVSDCERYRYRLTRKWGDGPALLYVMLNPSTADASQDDQTIRRCIGFAVDHGFNALEVVNLYAWRATDPDEMMATAAPVGDDNDRHIREAAARAGAVCLAYGAHEAVQVRAPAVLALLRNAGATLQCLAFTRAGYPSHPLCLPVASRLVEYREPSTGAAKAEQG